MVITIAISANTARYQDADNCLALAVAEYSEAHGLQGWDLNPRWADEQRDEILLDVPTTEAVDVTDEDIERLRIDAGAHGDDLQVALCSVALAGGLDEIAEIPDGTRSALERMGIVPEHIGSDLVARAECERVIRETWVRR